MRIFFVFLLLLSSLKVTIARADEFAAESDATTASDLSRVLGDGWGFRGDFEAKSYYDKKFNPDGTQNEGDFRIYRLLNDFWGPVVGITEDTDEFHKLATTTELSYVYAGVRVEPNFLGLHWRTDWFYNWQPRAQDRNSSHTMGSLEADIRTSFFVSDHWRTKVRWRFNEFVRTSSAKKIDNWESRVEAYPGYERDHFGTGIEDKLFNKVSTSDSSDYLEVGPFVRYDGEHFQPIARVLFDPFIAGTGHSFAPNWLHKPLYSVEAEILF